jgi:hypothetical protein
MRVQNAWRISDYSFLKVNKERWTYGLMLLVVAQWGEKLFMIALVQFHEIFNRISLYNNDWKFKWLYIVVKTEIPKWF